MSLSPGHACVCILKQTPCSPETSRIVGRGMDAVTRHKRTVRATRSFPPVCGMYLTSRQRYSIVACILSPAWNVRHGTHDLTRMPRLHARRPEQNNIITYDQKKTSDNGSFLFFIAFTLIVCFSLYFFALATVKGRGSRFCACLAFARYDPSLFNLIRCL